MKDRGRYSVLDDGTLMIENTQDSDEGFYECVARNQMGEAKARAVELRYLNNTRHSKDAVCLIVIYNFLR